MKEGSHGSSEQSQTPARQMTGVVPIILMALPFLAAVSIGWFSYLDRELSLSEEEGFSSYYERIDALSPRSRMLLGHMYVTHCVEMGVTPRAIESCMEGLFSAEEADLESCTPREKIHLAASIELFDQILQYVERFEGAHGQEGALKRVPASRFGSEVDDAIQNFQTEDPSQDLVPQKPDSQEDKDNLKSKPPSAPLWDPYSDREVSIEV